MMNLKNLFPLLSIMVFIAGCDFQTFDTEKSPDNSDEIIKIKYGTSFGYCLGYCYKELRVLPTELEFRSKDREDKLPEIVCSESFSAEKYMEIIDIIDLKSFFKLDEIIGCPDCADGGTEWIEITTLNTVYKVNFEYLNEPQELSDYIHYFRDHMKEFSDCEQ